MSDMSQVFKDKPACVHARREYDQGTGDYDLVCKLEENTTYYCHKICDKYEKAIYCDFCNQYAAEAYDMGDENEGRHYWVVECQECCTITIDGYDTREESIKAWGNPLKKEASPFFDKEDFE